MVQNGGDVYSRSNGMTMIMLFESVGTRRTSYIGTQWLEVCDRKCSEEKNCPISTSKGWSVCLITLRVTNVPSDKQVASSIEARCRVSDIYRTFWNTDCTFRAFPSSHNSLSFLVPFQEGTQPGAYRGRSRYPISLSHW